MSDTVFIGVGSVVSLTAPCDDANDILLSGFCGFPAAGATWQLTKNRPWAAETVGAVAYWECSAWNNAGGAPGGSFFAGALCVSVP
jgi:hypothetical protein